jgi:glycosyltransferase involved in cell wall biosynthesis
MPAEHAAARRRVLVTTSTLPRFEDDPEPRFVLDLARNLPPEWETVVLAPAAPGAADVETLGGVQVKRYRYAPLRRMEVIAYPGAIMPRLRARPWLWLLVPLLAWGLRRAIRQELQAAPYDLVHCHWLVPQGAVQASLKHAPPFIATSHGGDLHSFRSNGVRPLLRHTARRAAALTVVSRQLSAAAADLLESTAPAPEVIPMGVDRDHFHPRHRTRDHFLKLGIPGHVVFFVGRLAEKMGVLYLLRALADQRRARSGAQRAIAGDGPLRTELQTAADSLGIAGRVHFLGALPHSVLPAYYASADIFCAPSVVGADGDQEGMPTVLMEAMACGCACVSTRTGGIPEFLVDGETAELVQPAEAGALADAIAGLLTDAERRQRLGTAARDASAAFGWEVIASRYAQVYERALAGR